MIKRIIPVFTFFGEKDTQVDPIQGADAYKKALTKAGDTNFRVEIIPNADHDIILCKTGSLKERRSRSSKEWQNYAPEYLEMMEEWLKKLKKQLRSAKLNRLSKQLINPLKLIRQKDAKTSYS